VAESNRLNAMKVTKLDKPGRFGDGGGLYLRVAEYETKGGKARSKNWIFRFERGGRERLMGLGSLDTLSLAEARAKARECRQLLLEGVDPIEARAVKRAAMLAPTVMPTFAECARGFIKAHQSTWRNPVHAAQWPSSLERFAYPVVGKLPVDMIGTPEVLRILEPIWETVPDTARRVRGRVEQVLDWAAARSYRKGENPARWNGHLKQLLPNTAKALRRKHHAALPYAEIGAFTAELRAKRDISAHALEFLILTAARTSEVIGARWSEIDFAEKLWTVPATRMKSGRPHIVPLSDRAIQILSEAPRESDGGFIFIGRRAHKPLSNMALLEMLRGMRPGLTVHGFRSTFRDWAGDRTNYAREVMEAALAHVVIDETEAAYRRSTAVQKRRRMMAEWAKFCSSTQLGQSTVVNLVTANA